MDRLGALLVLALSVYAASAQTLTSSGSTEANEGDTVELVCRVSGLSFVSQQLKWAKVDNQDPQLTRELSSHLSVVHRPGHYKVVAVEESGDLIYTFSINGVEKSDDGRYKCFVEENAEMIAETSEVVTVRQPIESVELFVGPFQVDASSPDPQEFELDTFEPDLVIRCKVKGSNPAAEVKVMVGEMDITAELKRSDQAMYTGPSLESIRTYNTDLDSTAVYPLDQSVIGKVISCSAWLQGDEANVRAAKAQLTVKEPPKVECSNVTTRLGNRRVVLECTIKSLTKPQDISWFIDNDNPIFVPASDVQTEEYRAQQKEDGENQVKVSLEIGLIEEKHFDTIYMLKAKVSRKDLTHAVRLHMNPKTGGSVGGQGRITMGTSVMTTLVFLGGLLKSLM